MRNEPSREKVLETLGVLALACLVAGHLLRRHPSVSQGFLAAAVLLLAAALFARPVARRIAAAWLRFAEALGGVNTRIVLGLVFYLFLTPIALLARMIRGDFLHLRRKTAPDRSYWHARDHAYCAEDLGKTW